MNEIQDGLAGPEGGKTYTVGEISKMAGITVRTLQYYDRYGLLTCRHGDGGRRLYGRGDLVRLQQILFFKSYGFSLTEIRDRLIDVHSGAELAKLLEAQRDAIASQIAHLDKVTDNLNKMITEVKDDGEVSVDTFVATVELARLNDPYAFMFRYFNEHQVNCLIGRINGDSDKAARFQEKQAATLFSELLRLYKSGADPLGEDGQKLAECFWQGAVELSGGDPKMIKSFISMGIDTKNWPDDVKNLSSAVSEFMSVAMLEYLKSHDIPLDSFSDLLAP